MVAGFGSGDLVALRAESGSLAWSDSLAAARGRNSLADISAIRALPVIADGVVYAVGLGGLLLAIDLRSGRRLWEREAAGQNTPWVAGEWMFVVTHRAGAGVPQPCRRPGPMADPAAALRRTRRSRAGRSSGRGRCSAGSTSISPARPRSCLRSTRRTARCSATQDLPDAVSVPLVAAGGKMFVVTDDGTLTALG